MAVAVPSRALGALSAVSSRRPLARTRSSRPARAARAVPRAATATEAPAGEAADSDRDGDPGTDGLNCGYGISGYGRPPGQVDDIIDCRQRTGTVGGAGVYPATNTHNNGP